MEGGAAKSCAPAMERQRCDARKGGDLPQIRPARVRLINLEQRINKCGEEKMRAPPWAYGPRNCSDDRLSAPAVARVPVDIRVDGPAKPAFDAGRHSTVAASASSASPARSVTTGITAKPTATALISQGHRMVFRPIGRDKVFRSLHRQFTDCFGDAGGGDAAGSEDYVALEFYLPGAANGLPIEAPAVRP